MRIEGTYTFPATIERVFVALMDPDVLERALPGCERMLQFGPVAADGAASFEARLRPAPGASVYTVRIDGIVARRPTHLRLELRGRGPRGPVTGSGLIDLVAQDEFTVGAYVFTLEAEGVPAEGAREAQAAGQRFARSVCERLATAIWPPEDSERREEAQLAPGRGARRGGLVARTARGRIVALPPAPSVSPLSANAGAWMERVGWMATGMVLGMAALGLLVGLSRLLGGKEE